MRLPKRQIGGWAKELVDACSVSQLHRATKYAAYKNLYMTGDENGTPSTYPKTFAFIDNLSSMLFSPVNLKWNVDFYGAVGKAERAKARAIAAEMHRHMRQSNLDMMVDEAVPWSLVKGKVFIKTLWGGHTLLPMLIQPEFMGVYQENLNDLDDQEAFYQSMYMTPHQFQRHVQNHPEARELMRRAAKYIGGDTSRPNDNNTMRQVILGGMYPYQGAGSSQQRPSRGVVDWMNSPAPMFDPKVVERMIRVDELWVWNDAQEDWTTIQLAGEDCVLEGKLIHRNLFAHDPYVDPSLRKEDSINPLKGKHPFQELCPNRVDGYFWGRSEIIHVALLQKTLNARIDGLNMLYRLQEKPPKFVTGTTSINQQAIAKLGKPGGYLSDGNPNTKIQDLAPKLPEDAYQSVHEIEKMYDDMAGFAPVLQGRGESGVRAQGHAETLVRTSSPRFKDRAVVIERQVESIGGLALDILKAHDPSRLQAWVLKKDGGPELMATEQNPAFQPPVTGMEMLEFGYHDFPDNAKVVVDSHSSSPVFIHEAEQLMFDLHKAGAVSPEQLVAHTHPPGEDAIISEIQQAQVERAQFIAEHPEAALGKGGKHK